MSGDERRPGAHPSAVLVGPPSAYGVALPMGPQSSPLVAEQEIGGRRYTLWRYGDADLQAAADVWALRDDGLPLTIDTARGEVRLGHGERAAEDRAGSWADTERVALVAAARTFQTAYDKAEHTRKRRRRQAAG